MIHIENITINNQFPSAESGPTSALGDALLHAMAESLFAEQTKEELDSDGCLDIDGDVFDVDHDLLSFAVK
jgi:hypothetical protein